MFDYSSWYEQNKEKILEDFFTFLRFASIGSEPEHNAQTRACADWLKKYLEKIGLKVSLWEEGGHPALFAETEHREGYPTVLIYQHYDVQPVDPLELWESKPFEPTLRDGKVFARGASDNKGQCFYSITAVRAYLEAGGKCNIKLLIEGEEESGSHTLHACLPEKKEQLKCDHMMIVDIEIPDRKTPAITLGARGLITMNVECIGADSDLHSGGHGGLAYNPNRALAEVFAKLWKENGEIAIPGLYDDMEVLPEEELKDLYFDFEEERYKKTFGVRKVPQDGDVPPAHVNWLRPVLEINGMGGGYVGKGFKTVLPAKAIAKLSCRLPPGLKPDKVGRQIEEFLQSHLAQGMELNVTMHHGGPGYRTSVRNPTVPAVAKAYETVFGQPCRYVMAGGSIPIASELAAASGTDPILMGVALATDQIHAPNEHFELVRFAQGFAVMANTLVNLENV